MVAANGFFVAAEFALVKVRASQLLLLKDTGGWRVKFALRAVNHLDVALSATQLGITLASLGLGWVGKPIIAARLEPVLSYFGFADPVTVSTASFALAFGAITFLHIVFGELAPKSFAIQRPQRTSLLVSAPLLIFYYLLFPAIWGLNQTANAFLRWTGLGPGGGEGDHGFSPAEFEYLLGRARHAHPGDALVNRLMLSALRLREVTARQVMRPRSEIGALWLGKPHQDNLAIARAAGHSRFLVCGESLDEVRGVLLVREWLWRMQGATPDVSFESLIRPVLVFSEATLVHEMIAKFRVSRSHLAIVRNNLGMLVGLATFEDVLEEIVGSIHDESDTERGPIHEQSDGSIVVNATIPLRELQAETGWTFDGRPKETVGAWIERRCECPLIPGEELDIDDFRISVLKILPGTPKRLRMERRRSNMELDAI